MINLHSAGRSAKAVLAIALVAALSARAHATVLIAADLGELSRDAIAIARGHVVALTPQWTDGRRSIETLVTLEVEEYLKGALGSTVQFRVPGGDFGRLRSITVGAPEFQLDERVIIFLGARGPSVPYVLGLNQGVFRIVASADGADWRVMPPAALPSVDPGNHRIVRGDASRGPLSLADFEQHVRSLAGVGR